jgi:predicted N-acetyltransferase YhbS
MGGLNVNIRLAKETDMDFWFELDNHLTSSKLIKKIQEEMAFVLVDQGKPIGILRYQLFWDTIPFCTMLVIKKSQQNKGAGRSLLQFWEEQMRGLGYGMCMTSSQSDEQGQHFYRKCGYKDAGGLILDVPGFEQPTELFFVKQL